MNFLPFLFLGSWCKHVWESTLVQYKGCLKEWFKRTGGGSGLATEFESWDEAKLEKYKVDLTTYDHTDLAARPAILMNLYVKQKEPYVTFIHIWDTKTDHLLSSRYDPLNIGDGEPGMTSSSCATKSSSKGNKRGSRKRTSDDAQNEMKDVLNTVLKLCGSSEASRTNSVSSVSNTSNVTNNNKSKSLEDMSLDELYKLMDQYKEHLKFLEQFNRSNETKKENLLQKIESIFEIIDKKVEDSYNNTVSPN